MILQAISTWNRHKNRVFGDRSHFNVANNEPIQYFPRAPVPFFCLENLNLVLQVGLGNIFALGGTLFVHYRHSDSFPSYGIPVLVCAVGFVAVVTGLVLHQVQQ